MLDPYDRKHLKEILRPPEGYVLDYAIASTYSLDLMALMTAPVAFAAIETESDFRKADLLVLVEALRRYAGRISIFCHGGKIKIPDSYKMHLSSLLEESVFQVLPSNDDAVFHPKVWVLRYISESGPVAYRFLCLSRNLTYDRSWDTALVLDGIVLDEQRPIVANQPLSDFIGSLPGLVLKGLPEGHQKRIEQMREEIRRVRFDLPPGIESVIFHPLGIDNNRSDPISGRIERMLIISPFLSKSRLDHFAAPGKECILVSRLDSLQKVSGDCLGKFSTIFILKDDAAIGIEDRLDGLHAKLYAADSGNESRIWTGSANATEAAFSKNVEFLVELKGKKNICGIDALLNGSNAAADGKKICLRTLLEPFNRIDNVVVDPLESLKIRVTEARNALINADLSAHVFQDGEKNFAIKIEGPIITLPKDISIIFWPITLPEARALPLCFGTGLIAEFKNISKDEISAFFAFNLTVNSNGLSLCDDFVLKLPLIGAPADRIEHIIRGLLDNESQVLKLMMICLNLDREPVPGEYMPDPSGYVPDSDEENIGNGNQKSHHAIVPLFESMVRALSRDPQRIDDLNKLIQDLKDNPDKCKFLPKGLDEIWDPIWQARKNLKEAGHEEN